MASPGSDTARTVFLDALELADAADRQTYLDEACRDDAGLRREVEDLLRHHSSLGAFLEVGPTTSDEGPGATIGPYTLGEEIGEGGFGVVHAAEQTHPLRRRVAVKLIKPGMDSREVLSRFSSEREALALMDHPNIARILDAGSTPGGRPYFVMELVEGIPITTWCDTNGQSVEDRLRLFVRVCRAVQHAHQKGIIHRDLKPHNVLVEVRDRGPVPKVIDFGVAKAIDPRLTAESFRTRAAQMIGTPQYMSPEQAELSAIDVDTRADVYSLGVLLYELLTGTTPFAADRLGSATFEELRRILREEEPPPPSACCARSAERGAEAARARCSEPARLARKLRGDLDWIVMQAIAKDRARRYESAGALAADVERFLRHDPVEAARPSLRYRLGKFVRRHVAQLTVAVTVLVALAVVGALLLDRAGRREARNAGLASALADIERSYAAGQLKIARATSERAEAFIAGGGVDAALAGRASAWRKDLQMLDRLDRARLARTAVKNDAFDRQACERAYGEAFRWYGIDTDALPRSEAAARIAASAIGKDLVAALQIRLDVRQGPVTAANGSGWDPADPVLAPIGDVDGLLELVDVADPQPWRKTMRRAGHARDLEALRRLARSPELATQGPATRGYLAHAIARAGDVEAAVAVLREAQDAFPSDFWVTHDLALQLEALDPPRTREAVGFLRAAIALRPGSPGPHQNLARALLDLHDYSGAARSSRHAIALKPDYWSAIASLVEALEAGGRLEEALAVLESAAGRMPDSAACALALGDALSRRNRMEEAHSAYDKAISLVPDDVKMRAHIGDMLYAADRFEEARALYEAALAMDADNASAVNGLGNTFVKLGDVPQGLRLLARAVELAPDEAPIHYNYGIALFAARRNEDAEKEFRRAIELDGKLPQPHNYLAVVAAARGDIEEALRENRIAERKDPDEGLWSFNVGVTLRMLNRPDEAERAYRAALSAPRPHLLAGGALGALLYDQGRYREAARFLDEAVRQIPRVAADLQVQYQLGVALTLSGDPAAAVSALERAESLSSHGASARGALAGALLLAHRSKESAVLLDVDGMSAEAAAQALNAAAWLVAARDKLGPEIAEQAVGWAKEALNRAPQSGALLNTLGVALVRAGRWQEAVEALESSMQRRDGGDASDWLFLAMAHARLGEREKAGPYIERARSWVKAHRPRDEEYAGWTAEAEAALAESDGATSRAANGR